MNRVITVITATKNRVKLLERAIQSVKNQIICSVHHLIIIDGCEETFDYLTKYYSDDDSLTYFFVPTGKEKAGPERLSFLRNMAIYNTTTEYIAFLDDDNEYLPNHLKDLYEFSKNEKCDAVHSYRRIFYNDGSPYLEELSPWGYSLEERRNNYRMLLNEGIVSRGSNEWHDKYGVTIDTNVWLIKTSLLKKHPFPIEYCEIEYNNKIPEDTKLMLEFMKYNVIVKTNRKPSVNYYLGGYSNSLGNTIGSVNWEY